MSNYKGRIIFFLNNFMKENILLVEPDFPIPAKSKNHKNFLPIGLLKIASYMINKGIEVRLIRGFPKENLIQQAELIEFDPTEIWITSLFTYWSEYVRDSVQYYKIMFPKAKVKVGGIYASLMPEHCKKYTGCDYVFKGVYKAAENCFPIYDLLNNTENPHPIDYQIVHASRGCIRRCDFCGTWKIERHFEAKKSIKDTIRYRKAIFYDNNLLANPNIDNLLNDLIELKKEKKILWCESQSGFDGRKLLEKPYLAGMLKKAGFRYPRIAWDWKYNENKSIKRQIEILVNGGYNSKDIFVFMLYNWDIPFKKMEKKRIKCLEWRVQIADCRYRPLDQTYDHYKSGVIGQTSEDYYIHEKSGWTDALVKQFRKNVREQNICVRHNFPFYSKCFETKKFAKEIRRNVKELNNLDDKIKYLKSIEADYWIPDEIRCPSIRIYKS